MKKEGLVPSVCIDAVFEGKSFSDACRMVKQANISAIEFWGWWDKDLDALQQAVSENGLSVSACCTKFISLVNPALRDEYLQGLEESIDIARQLQATRLISQVGDYRVGVSREEQKQSLVDGLKEAASMLSGTGITLVIEPLNELVDHAGYFLIISKEAFEIIDEVNSPNVKVIFDIYHQQISEGHLIYNIVNNIEKIGHFHAAGNPGRNELQRGEIHYKEVFSAIKKSGFNGHVGFEYWPLEDDPIQSLSEAARWCF